MTQEPKAAQEPQDKRAQAALYVESILALMENPLTPHDVHEVVADEACQLITDAGSNIVKNLRFNQQRIVDYLAGKPDDEPTPDMEAIAEGGGQEACVLLDWLLTYLLHDPNKGHDKEGDVIAQKSSAVLCALNADDESPEFLFLLSRLRKLFAAAGSQIQQTQEGTDGPITPKRAEEITSAVITLMSGPLPERLSEDLGHALIVMASGPAVADTSYNPDMLRIWLPAVLIDEQGGES